MAEWASVLPGFDQTRHAISNIRVKLFGISATATANVVAFHWMGEETWQVSGIYIRLCEATGPMENFIHDFCT